VIKHIITSDALIIPTSEGILQFNKTDSSYNRMLSICKMEDSNYEDLFKVKYNLNFENDDISLSYNTKSEEYELFYNSKYYYLDETFISTIFSLINDVNINFRIEYLANFLLKIFNNPYFKFNDLLEKLFNQKFLFLSNGNIVIEKIFESEYKKMYDRKRFFSEPTLVNKTLAIIDPSTIEGDYSFTEYRVLDSYFFNDEKSKLHNTWIRNEQNFIPVYNKIIEFKKNESEDKLIVNISKKVDIDYDLLNDYYNHVDKNITELAYEIVRIME
jgi:hypothetical protein